ncbi:MAG: cytochrome P460 family protein, partial [Pseudomonadota bacterium]
MQKINLSALATAALVAIAAVAGTSQAQNGIAEAKFTADGQVMIPEDWRSWVYIGTPLTPNALNDGKAPFPEFHNVYIEPSAFAHWKKTGKFAEGTQIAKELVLVRQKDKDEMNDDGSTAEVSGIGYFQGEFAGLELTVKDNGRFAKEPGGWAYFS